MAYGDFKDLARRTYSDKVLRDKAFNIAKNHKYDGYQRGLASMVYKFFDKTSKGSGFNISLESNEELAEELRKPVIKKFKKEQQLMQLISKINKGFRFLLCVADIFSKYALVVPLNDKNGVTITFQKLLDDSNRKPNKIWVDKGTEFYNSFLKKWLKDNDIEMYLIHNEGKPVVDERFIRPLKTKIYDVNIKKCVYR